MLAMNLAHGQFVKSSPVQQTIGKWQRKREGKVVRMKIQILR